MRRIVLLVALVLGACEAEMYRIDTPNAAAVMPTPSAVGAQGYFQDTDPGGSTDLSADFFNALQEEIAAVIEDAGLTLDKADSGQLSQAIALGIAALISDVSDTGSVTTQHRRAVVASSTSTASGADSACVASSSGSVASGADSACVASDASTASGSPSACVASDDSTASGNQSACVASESSTASGTVSACVASESSTASGTVSACVASYNSTTSGGRSACVASDDGTVSGDRSALVCSNAGAYDLADDDTLAGAASGAMTWALHSDTGDAEFTGDVAVTGEAAAGTLKVGGGYGATGLSVAADGDLQTDGDVTVGAGGGAGGVSINAASGEVVADVITVTSGNAYQIGAATGASGSFTTADGKTVTVVGGIITQIV